MIEIDESLEVDLYYSVLLFSLTIDLQLEGGWKLLLDANEVIERWPEFWDE